MKSKKKMTAAQLRIILSIAMIVILAAGVGIFKIGQSKLSDVAQSVAETGAQADAGQQNLQQLATTKQSLKDNADVVRKASEMVAESKSYQYQNQIVTDLDRFASSAGITITNITFDSSTSSGSAGGTAAGAAPTTPAATPSAGATGPAAAGSAGMAGAVPGGAAAPSLKTVSATISFDNPVNYKNFLQFIHDIEQNLTKMQLKSLSLSQADGGVSSDSLTLEVYIK